VLRVRTIVKGKNIPGSFTQMAVYDMILLQSLPAVCDSSRNPHTHISTYFNTMTNNLEKFMLFKTKTLSDSLNTELRRLFLISSLNNSNNNYVTYKP